ncbi:MAG TPA: DNA polymerase Y family protein, partial [Flavihumibacter sp.]|nr:DNA polymerase Y family protein [Flavihumibacter sp.]
MQKTFVCIWFKYFKTDRLLIRQPDLKDRPLVLIRKEHGKMLISAANEQVLKQGVQHNTSLADARAIIPGLLSFDDLPEKATTWLKALAVYCNRFCPSVSLSGT